MADQTIQNTKPWINMAFPNLEEFRGRILESHNDSRPGEKVFSVTAYNNNAQFGDLAFLAFSNNEDASDAFFLGKPVAVKGQKLNIEYSSEPSLEKPEAA